MAALLLLGLGSVPGGAAAASGCGPDCPSVGTAPGSYVGSLLLPPSSGVDPPALRAAAASCDGCVWTLEPACPRPDLTGTMCAGAAFSCGPGSERMALWLQRPGEVVPTRVGAFCFDPAVPLQPTTLVPGVRDRFRRLVPRLTPSAQPPDGGLVNLPVVFATGQRSSLGRPRFVLAGRVVVLAATAAWTWRFGDGCELTTRDPGGPWPDLSVAHAFARRGRFAVRVVAQWQARFWVDGEGPFEVSGSPVSQTAVLRVLVRPATAVLVGLR